MEVRYLTTGWLNEPGDKPVRVDSIEAAVRNASSMAFGFVAGGRRYYIGGVLKNYEQVAQGPMKTAAWNMRMNGWNVYVETAGGRHLLPFQNGDVLIEPAQMAVNGATAPVLMAIA